MTRLAALLAFGLALPLTGCGADEGGRASGSNRVETTRVEIVEGLGKKGGFDPTGIYRRLSPGVVTVISIFDGAGSLAGDSGEGGQGSGFVLDDQGYIATNAHVVTTRRATKTKQAKSVFVDFSDGNRVPARIVGDDPNADVALLKVEPRGLSLAPLRLGSTRHVTVGAPVAAIGSPFGERQSLSVGVISAVDRTIESLTQFQIGNAIQTDAAINPGNSGGPLLDGRGRVVGINAQIKSQSGGGEGVGFAIPVSAVRRSLGELREKGRVDYGFLGVTAQSLYPQLAEQLDLDVSNGALIVGVEKDGPADKAGIEAGGEKITFQGQRNVPKGGDVIASVDGKRLTRQEDLADVISRKSAGEKVRLEILRGDERRIEKVALGARPDRPPPAKR